MLRIAAVKIYREANCSRKIDLTGWEEIDETKIPQWVYKRAYKIADKTGRWEGIYLTGKHYRYYIEHLGGQGTIAYRKTEIQI